MENDYKQMWADCLALIRQKYGEKYQHWFDVWFADVQFESYDPTTRTLLVQLPSNYVYEFLEMYGVKTLTWATQEVFKGAIKLNYRICDKVISAGINLVRQKGLDPFPSRPHIAIPDARTRIERVGRQHLGSSFRWLPSYADVVKWLTDSEGRGLLCTDAGLGRGRGMTFLCRSVLPVILGGDCEYCTAVDMMAYDNEKKEARIDQLLRKPCAIIDNLGSELTIETNYYGRRRRPFEELCDAVEQRGILLIVNTHLWPNIKRLQADGPDGHAGDPDPNRFPSIEECYGEHVFSILRSTSTVAYFYGEDLRKKE